MPQPYGVCKHMSLLVMACGLCDECTEWPFLPLLQVGVVSCYLFSHPPAIPSIWWGYSSGCLAESHPVPLPSLHGENGSSFPGCIISDDIVSSKSVMDAKLGDSGLVIRYQVDEFTCTWLAECFIAQSHIYPGFTGKVSMLIHFPLEPWTNQSKAWSMVFNLSSKCLSTHQN